MQRSEAPKSSVESMVTSVSCCSVTHEPHNHYCRLSTLSYAAAAFMHPQQGIPALRCFDIRRLTSGAESSAAMRWEALGMPCDPEPRLDIHYSAGSSIIQDIGKSLNVMLL